jgi:hypothetical protein
MSGAQAGVSSHLRTLSIPGLRVAPSLQLSAVPAGAASADLNGDGIPDLVVTTQNPAGVTVLLGDGKGNFAPANTYSAGKQPRSVLLADIDGDGHLDAIVIDAATGSVEVLAGNGDGSFRSAVAYSAVKNPVGLTLANLSGKGKIDLVVAGSNAIAVLSNDGSGHFTVGPAISLAAHPLAIASGDLTGQGHDDVLLANQDGSLQVLLGDGLGHLHALSKFALAAVPSSLVVADFNHDGKADVAIAYGNANSAGILFGHGNGTFEPGATYKVGSGPTSILAADLRETGALDLITVNQAANTFSVLRANGDGTFHPAVDFVSGNVPVGAVVGNFTGSGHADIATFNAQTKSIAINAGNGDGTFVAARSYPSGGLEHKSIAAGDLNGDGRTDLVVSNLCGEDAICSGQGNARVFLAQADGTYRFAATYPLPSGPMAVGLADLKGDHILSLVVLNHDDNSMTILPGNGDGSFGEAQNSPLSGSPRALLVGDFNHDGKADLAIASDCGANTCPHPGSLNLLLGRGDGTFTETASYTTGFAPVSIASGDLRGTGHADLVVANRCGEDTSCKSQGTASVFLNDGQARLTPGTGFSIGSAPSSIAIGRLSGAGLDLAVAQSGTDTVAVFHSNGNGGFGSPALSPVGSAPSSVTIADTRAIGVSDLVVANSKSSTLSLLYGTGTGSLQSAVTVPVGTGPEAVVAVQGSQRSPASLVTANGNGGAAPMGADITVIAGPMAQTAPGSVTLTVTPAGGTSTVDEQVTLAVTVAASGGLGTPTGNVEFEYSTNGGKTFSPLGDCGGTSGLSLDGTGAVNCVTQQLPAGTLTLQGNYLGDGTIYSAAASNTVAQTVAKAATTVVASSSPAAPSTDEVVTFSAIVSPSPAATVVTDTVTIGGSVAFSDGATPIAGCGTQALTFDAATGTATATCTMPVLSVGSHSITAVYAGDPNYTANASAALPLTVTKANTAVTVVPSPTSSTVNQSVQFNVTVTPVVTGTLSSKANLVAISGTVDVLDGVNAITNCTAVTVTFSSANENATASCSTSTLTAATHQITARYNGSTSYNTFTSTPAVPLVVAKADTTASLATSAGTVNLNQSVTLTATIKPTSPAVALTGTVGFTENGQTITGCSSQNVTSGAAQCITSALPAGNPLAIIANFTDTDGNYNSSSANVSQVVKPGSSSVALQSSSAGNTSKLNAPVTFTATVTPATNPVPLSGTVTLTENGAGVSGCVVSWDPATGIATCTTSSLSLGSHTIVATYSGDTNYPASGTASVTQTVTKATATIALKSSSNPATFNNSVTFTATLTLTPSGSVGPTGSVEFQDSVTSADIPNCSAVGLVAGAATCSTSNLTLGSHTITALYNNDSNYTFQAGGNTVVQVVNQASGLTMALASSANPASVNQSPAVNFTATISVGSGVSGITGTVKFTDGGTTIANCGAVPVSVKSTTTAIAPCSDPALNAAGSPHTIAATYSGDTNFPTASATLTPNQAVAAATTSLALMSSQPSSAVNANVTFTATLTAPTGGVPLSGTVAFTDTINGSTTTILNCGAQAVSAVAPLIATCSTSTLAKGSHQITANYTDSTLNFGPSNATTPQTVGSATVSLVLTTSSTTAVVNQGTPLLFTVKITAPAGTTNLNGVVAFTDNGASIAACSAVAPSPSGSNWVAICSDGAITVPGSPHTIVATYLNDPNFGSSAPAQVGPITVSQASTSTTVITSVSPSSLNQPITFTATLTAPAGGVSSAGPNGTYNFVDSVTALSIAGCSAQPVSAATSQATCSTAALAQGSHIITATYTDSSGNFVGSKSSVTQNVSGTATTTTVVPSASTITVNDTVIFTATVNLAVPPPSGSVPPTWSGNMAFALNGNALNCIGNANTPQNVVPVNKTTGVATCQTNVLTVLPSGTDNVIFATYGNDTNFLTSSGSTKEIVNPVTVNVSLGASVSGAIYAFAPGVNTSATTVTFTANVLDINGHAYGAGNGDAVPLSGTVSFLDNGNAAPICSAAVAGNTVSCTCNAGAGLCPALPDGMNNITARYSNDLNTKPADSSPLPQIVIDFGLTNSSTPPVIVSQGFDTGHDPFTPQTINITPSSLQFTGVSAAQSYQGSVTLNCTVTAVQSADMAGATLPTCSPNGATSIQVVQPGTGVVQQAQPYVIGASGATPGQYTVTVTAVDANNLTRATTFPLIVRAVSSTVSIASGGNFTTNVSYVLPSNVTLSGIACDLITGTGFTAIGKVTAANLTCSPQQTSLGPLTATGTVNDSVKVQTGQATAALARSTNLVLAGLFGLPLVGFLLLRGRRSFHSALFRVMAICAICISILQVLGCGGSFTSNQPKVTGGTTPPGQYYLLVHGTGSDGHPYEAVIVMQVTL